MSRHRKDPLRPLTAEERQELTRLSRSPSVPTALVDRASALLAIADRASYTAAAHLAGRRHNETVPIWISRSNREGHIAILIQIVSSTRYGRGYLRSRASS